MSISQNNFRCVIVSPTGKLLDCNTVSVTFTAHDGSMGVLHNHMPMLCELGLGIMEIAPADDTESAGKIGGGNNHGKRFALIDKGFALINSNVVNIIASDAVCGWDTNREKIEQLLEKSKKKFSRGTHTLQQFQYETQKNALLEKLLTTL